MRKPLNMKALILTVILLAYQLFVPMGNVFVSANATMLPPSNLEAQKVTPDDVKLNWSAVFGATGYFVYEIKEGQIIPLEKTTSTSYNLNNLAEGTYNYVVSTLTAEGESGPSAPVTVEISYPEMATPTNLTHSIKNGNDIVLNWDASEYTENYNVYAISDDNEKTLVSSVAKNTYSVSDVAEGTYTYAISAANSLYGESEVSNPVTVEVIHPTITAPSNVTYSISNGNDLTLKWESVTYATDYNVYQLTNGKMTLIDTITSNSVKYPNLPAGDYTYEIRANSNRFGESVEGSQVTATVSSITMEAPTNVRYSLQNINDINITWDSVSYANSYKVYQVIDGEKVLKSTVDGTSIKYTNMPGGDYVYEVYSYSDRFGESPVGSKVSLNVESVTMLAPKELTYEVQNGNDIILKWEESANADNYKIYQIINGEKVLKSTVSGKITRFNNLPEGDYHYEVHSYSKRFGESEESSQLSIQLNHPEMESPSNLTETIKSASSFTLSWDDSPYATNYKVYQIIDGKKVLKNTVTRTTVSYSNQVPGDYTFVVHAYSSRFGESEVGSEVSFTLTGLEMEAPSNLTSTILKGNDIKLTWSRVDNADSYNIYQMVDGEAVLLKTVTGISTTFTNLPEGEHVYLVHSNSKLFGESTENATVTILLVHPTMENPDDLTYRVQNGNDIVLNWSAVEYADEYNVYELVGEEKVLVRTVSNLSRTVTNVSEGEHTYIVHSSSSRFGESLQGTTVIVDVIHPILEAPENLTLTIQNGNDIFLRWNTAEYANSYNVYQVVDGQPVLERTVTGTSVRFNNMPEGDYTYEIRAESSRFGESSEGSQTSISLVHPIMQAPENLTFSILNGNDISLRWNVVEYATSYNVYQVVDGELVLERTVTGTSARFNNMPEGEYSYVIHAESSRFGESVEGEELSLTLIHPIMQAPEKLTQSIQNGNDIVLRWDKASYATAYNVYQIVDGELEFEKTLTGTSIRFNNMPEGNYEYVVHSFSDRFDESPKGSSIDFTLVWPEVESPQVSGTVVNVNNITLTWPQAAWANGYKVYQLTNNERSLVYEGTSRTAKIYNLTEETHSFEVIAYSTRFGDSLPSNRITETIVYPIMEPPTASLTLLSDTSARITWNFITYANGYNIYEIIDGKHVLIEEKVNNLSYTIKYLSYANHEYVVTAYSNSFGESNPSNVVLAKLILDTEAPVTTANAPSSWVNEDQTITLSATDNETGVENTYYSINGEAFKEGTTFEVKGEGIHTISFYSVDKVDNVEEIQTIEVKIDKTAPITTANAPSDWVSQDQSITLSATDNKAGVATTYYSIDGGAFKEGTTFDVKGEGIHTVSFYSIDEVGNVEEIQTIEVKIDKTAPNTTANAPSNWVSQDQTVTLSATDHVTEVEKTYYSINGEAFVEGTSFEVKGEGIHEVFFYSVDKVGNVEEIQTIEVKIDKTAPTVHLNVEEEYGLGSTLELLYEATDELSGILVEEMTVRYPDGTVAKGVANGTTISLDQPGTYNVTVIARDHAGLMTEVQKQFVVYIPATIEVTAKVIKGNNGVFTVRVDVPNQFNKARIDLDTATVNGINALTSNKGYYNQAKNGQFKFERSDYQWTLAEEVLTFRGYIDGYLVVGQTTVKTVNSNPNSHRPIKS